MELILYNCSSDKKRITKNLTEIKKYETCRLKEDTDVLNPTFIVNKPNRSNVPLQDFEMLSFNYIYCPWLKRYYFVDKIRLAKGGILEIDCHVDVLMTYKDSLYKHNVYVTRCEQKFFSDKNRNGIFYDSSFPIRSDVTVQTIDIGSVANSYSYYLTVNGGVLE